MRYKATFAAGFALGYTLGARAGRERYEQIVAGLRTAAESPAVQSAAGLLQARASELLGSMRRTVGDQVAQRVGGRAAAPSTPYPPSFSGAASGGTPNGYGYSG